MPARRSRLGVPRAQTLGGTESYTYDSLYRLTGVSYADGVTHGYSYDAVGNRLTSTQGGAGTPYTYQYAYDAADRLTAVTPEFGPGWAYTNDAAGNRTGQSVGGITTTYCYDALGRLTDMTDQAACPVRPTRVNAGGGVYLSPGGTLWPADAYANAGSLSTTTAAIANTTDDPLYQSTRQGTSFGYAFTVPNGTYTVTLKFSENSWTAAGKRVFNVAIEGTTVLSNFDIYAAAGGKNVAIDQSFPVTVSDGMLNVDFSRVVDNAAVCAIEIVPTGGTVGSALASYTYRGDGLRHSRTMSGTTTTYTWDVAVGLPVVVQDGQQTYVYGHGLISQTDAGGFQQYVLTDGLGSTAALTNITGAVTDSYAYDAFGAVRSPWSGSGTEYRFSGQQDDDALGFLYLRARYYDPATGRFLSKDPFPGVATLPASQHAYAYALNNPTNLVDPRGLFPGEDAIERVLNALAEPAFAPAGDEQLGDGLPELLSRSEACGTGSALPAIDAAENALMILALVVQPEVGAPRGAYAVYRSLNAAGETQYVGITLLNLARRAAEHARNGMQILPIRGLAGLTRGEARGVEQALIEEHLRIADGGTLLNKINSISRTNPAYNALKQRGIELLHQAGYPGF